MPIEVPTAAEVAQKWQRRAAAAGQDYRAGILATNDWAGPTAAAEPVYVQAVTEAAAAGRFARGVTQAGTAKWKTRSLAVGQTRFTTGVAAAEADYAAAMAPVLAVIAAIELLPRGPRGDIGNYDRSKQVGEALHQFKLQAGN